MKKMILASAILLAVATTHAQFSGMLDKAKAAAGAVGFDANKLTTSIMGKLTPSLNLTAEQKPRVTTAISTFLAAKAQIMPLLQSNKTDYTAKQTSLFSNLKTKLTGILLQNQMNKFLGLKPATNTPTNVLSQLFY
ncbi:hypothetical protein ACFOW1_01125 [Parasediminibacterium paludis]|uniref:Uncharacterized protein n=1 Tax=Parasediminibacterium paludis TaxID=908966 RepID=A0ABV8PQP7_9BACT